MMWYNTIHYYSIYFDTLWYIMHMVHYGTIRYIMMWYITIQFDTYNTLWYNILWYNTIYYAFHTLWYDTIYYDTLRYNTTVYDSSSLALQLKGPAFEAHLCLYVYTPVNTLAIAHDQVNGRTWGLTSPEEEFFLRCCNIAAHWSQIWHNSIVH